VCTEATTVLRTVALDFFFNCWYLEIPSDNRIWHVPRCVQYHEQSYRLKTFQNFYAGSGSRTPELYSESPDWFENCFMYEKFVACREFHLPEWHSIPFHISNVKSWTQSNLRERQEQGSLLQRLSLQFAPVAAIFLFLIVCPCGRIAWSSCFPCEFPLICWLFNGTLILTLNRVWPKD
jgi:hypothetical protein